MKDLVQNINHQFYQYVAQYDTTEDNIIRKIIHTTTVADMCFTLACRLQLNADNRNLAYLCGMLHDIGRFEQWKRYQTYNDKISVDHGDLSYTMSQQFDLSMLNPSDQEAVRLAIKYHNKDYAGNNQRVKLLRQIIINADAYANVLNTANGAQRIVGATSGYTPEILRDFTALKPLWQYSAQTKLDRVLMLTACLYYVRYDFLKKHILQYNLFNAVTENCLPHLTVADQKIYADAIQTMRARYLDPNYTNNLN